MRDDFVSLFLPTPRLCCIELRELPSSPILERRRCVPPLLCFSSLRLCCVDGNKLPRTLLTSEVQERTIFPSFPFLPPHPTTLSQFSLLCSSTPSSRTRSKTTNSTINHNIFIGIQVYRFQLEILRSRYEILALGTRFGIDDVEGFWCDIVIEGGSWGLVHLV